MNKEIIIKKIEEFRNSPKSVFEWIDFFDLDKEGSKEFISIIDELVDTYEVIIKDNLLYLGKWDDYYTGQIKVNQRGFGFIDFDDRPSIYVSKENLRNVYDKDTIVVSVINDKDEGVVVKVVSRNLKKIVGTVLTRRKPIKFIADNLMYENQIRINNIQKYKNIHRHKVLLQVISFENGYILCDIIEILGHMDDPGVDILAVLLENEVRVEWPEDVKQSLNSFNDHVTDDEMVGRLDLTDELIFSIDGDDAKDLDDAVSISKKGNNYVLGVHIVDVDHYVTKGSPIDVEAFKRGTSVYVIDRVVSMLPPQLSNGICSLNPHEKRLTISVMMEINKNGNVVEYDIKESVIENNQRLTYNKVNQVIANPGSVKEYLNVQPSLLLMDELAEILQERRNKLGAIDFDKDEVDLKVNDKGDVVEISLKERGIAERIIENFMVTTNETISRLMAYSEWPSIYRVHEKPDPAKMRDFAGLAQILGFQLKGNMDDIHPHQLQKILNDSNNSESHFVLANQLLRSMQKARYDHNNLGHFGLGSSEYGHFTSPIRRYPDLMLHRLLKKYFFNNNFNEFQSDISYISEAAKSLSELERKAIMAEREVNDMKIAEYMESEIGKTFDGSISSVHNFGMFVQLTNLVEGLVKVDTMDGYFNTSPDGFSLVDNNRGTTYKIGQKVRVKVIGASKIKRNVDFELVVTNKNKRKKKQHENNRK